MAIIDVLAALSVPLIWGINIAIIKMAVAEFPPIFVTGLRFFLVALLLIWWWPVPRKQLRLILLLSFVFGGLHFGSFFYGLRGVDVSVMAILTMAGVPCSVICARIILKERFDRRQIVGMLIALAGVLILSGEPTVAARPFYLFVSMCAMIAWGFGNVLIRMIGSINPFSLNAWMGLFASIQLLALSFVSETGQVRALQLADKQAWFCVFYLVVMATIISYGIWYYLIGKYGVSRTVPFTLLSPVVGVCAGMMIMGEPLGVTKVVGGCVTLIGVAVIQIHRPFHLRMAEHGQNQKG